MCKSVFVRGWGWVQSAAWPSPASCCSCCMLPLRAPAGQPCTNLPLNQDMCPNTMCKHRMEDQFQSQQACEKHKGKWSTAWQWVKPWQLQINYCLFLGMPHGNEKHESGWEMDLQCFCFSWGDSSQHEGRIWKSIKGLANIRGHVAAFGCSKEAMM